MPPQRPMRVHVLIDSLNWGGAETLLADYAIGARQAGIEVSVAHLSDRPGAEHRLREQGIEPELLGVSGLLSAENRRAVRRHLAELAPDLLHTHLGYSDFYGGLAARSLGLPMVSTLHTMEDPSGLRDRSKGRLMAWARRRGAHRVIAVSEALRRHYLESGRDRPERVVTVRNGIVGEPRPGAGSQVRAELGLDADCVVVGMVSVLRRGKGHELAAEAIAELRTRHPKLRLLVLGTGPDEEEIGRMLAPLGAGAVMTGHRDDVLGALDAVDVLIHPSRIDALPTALMEAMAARVPVIATRVGGIPEIVVDGETGLLIDAPPRSAELAAALERLLAEPDLRARLGREGQRRFAAEFSVESWIGRLLPVYRGAIAARRDRDQPAASAQALERTREVSQ